MSESSFFAQPVTGPTGFATGSPDYKLSDDLARLCLPQEFKDSYRRLAWVNSICFLFLLVGLIGLKPPRIIVKQLVEIQEPVPVIWTPPEEAQKPEPEVKPDDAEEPKDTAPEEAPQVVTVVATADPSTVAFAVPVPGAVAIAQQAHLATPPPPAPPAPKAPAPKPAQFNPQVADGGSYPPPLYPGTAQRNHYQGTVTIEFRVDESGNITDVKLQKSSGFPSLDEAALDVIKTRWRFRPGPPRWLYWPFIFKLE